MAVKQFYPELLRLFRHVRNSTRLPPGILDFHNSEQVVLQGAAKEAITPRALVLIAALILFSSVADCTVGLSPPTYGISHGFVAGAGGAMSYAPSRNSSPSALALLTVAKHADFPSSFPCMSRRQQESAMPMRLPNANAKLTPFLRLPVRTCLVSPPPRMSLRFSARSERSPSTSCFVR